MLLRCAGTIATASRHHHTSAAGNFCHTKHSRPRTTTRCIKTQDLLAA